METKITRIQPEIKDKEVAHDVPMEREVKAIGTCDNRKGLC
jgi:hypothetical protein